MTVYFNPLNAACKSVTGAIKQNQTLRLRVFLLKEEYASCVNPLKLPEKEWCQAPNTEAFLHINRDGETASVFPMEKTEFGWTISFSLKSTGLYYYTFFINDTGYISRGALEAGEITPQPKGFLLTVYSKDYQTPEWFKGGVMYQIFPDRFCKDGTMSDITGRVSHANWNEEPYFRPNEHGKVLNNDFFGGNFKGIQSKLPYLQRLGVTVIYLNPVFEAASNHRYDTSDYMKIDPYLGSEDDFSELINEAKQYGIRIILDGVFNHTGDDSVYFNKYGRYPTVGAYQSKQSPYYSWYSFQEYPDKYASWWGIDILPEINENSEDYQNFIFGEGGVLKKWLQFGIGGYRLDVADELPDFFLKKLRKSVKESNSEAVIIGEVWEDASDKIAYSKRKEYLQGYELDSVMNYPLKEGIIGYIHSGDAARLLHTIHALIDHYPKQTLDSLMNILGTHDTARILTVLGGIYCSNKEEMAKESAYLSAASKAKAIEKLKMAAVLQFTMPGVPCIYYGDENGAEGHIDPFCRRCFDWNNLNEDLISFYSKLGEIRKTHTHIFKDGSFKAVHVERNMLFYKRENTQGDALYVFVNNGSKRYLLNLPEPLTEILTNADYINNLEIQPYAYGILKRRAAVKKP